MRCGTPVTYSVSAADGAWVQITSISYGPEVSGPCAAGQYVALLPSELPENRPSPFDLTVTEAGQIGSAILSLWALAFGIRMAIRALRTSDQSPDDSE